MVPYLYFQMMSSDHGYNNTVGIILRKSIFVKDSLNLGNGQWGNAHAPPHDAQTDNSPTERFQLCAM